MKRGDRDAAYLWDMLDAALGMRNVLAHRYGAIDPSRVWSVVSEDLPVLVRELETATG